MPKAMPDSGEPMALTAVGRSTPTLARFDPKSDSICLARLKQLNRKDREDRKEQSLRGLCGLGG
jgi:hypothetical protein